MPKNRSTSEPSLPDAAIAAVDLIGRTGAKEVEFGFLHDDVPVEQAGWWAYAQYPGARLMVQDHTGPTAALEALVKKVMTGAQCKCGALVALADGGAIAYRNSTLADGTTWTAKQAERAGQCRWRRQGRRWVSACGRTGRPDNTNASPADGAST